MLVEVWTIGVVGVRGSVTIRAAIVVRGIYAFVKQLWRCAPCPTLTFEVFHEAV